MNSISLPEVNATLNSVATPSVGERRVLICGQIGGGETVGDITATAGTATAGVPVENVNLFTPAEVRTKFGSNSLLSDTILRFLEASGRQCALDVIGLDASTSVDATNASASLSLSGDATADGTIRVNILSKTDYSATVNVSDGDSSATVTTAIKEAIQEYSNAPFTVVEDTGALSIECFDIGTIGNNYSISVSGIPDGLTLTLGDFDSGLETPTVSGVFDNLPETRYTGILWPKDWESDISEVLDVLDARYNASNTILDGIAAMGYYDTASNITTFLSSYNNKNLVVLGNAAATASNVSGGAITYHEDLLAAEFLAYRDVRLTTNATITDITATNATFDQIGGMPLASLPYFNTPMQYTPQPSDKVALFSKTTMDSLTTAGFTVVGRNVQDTAMLLNFTTTTYNTDTQGNSDITFKYLNYVDTASVIREYIFNNLKADFAQSRLTDGDLRSNRSFANASLIKSRVKGYLIELAESDLYGSLVQAGNIAQRFIDQHLSVSIDLTNRTVIIGAQVPIVGQLGTINFPITITTNVGA